MTDSPNASEILSRLQDRYRKLVGAVSLPDVSRQVVETGTTIAGLPSEVAKARDRGYAYAGYLNAKAESLTARWEEAAGRIDGQIRTEASGLKAELQQLEPFMSKLSHAGTNAAVVQSLASQLEPRMAQAEQAVKEAGERVEATYAQLGREMREIQQQLHKIKGYMDAVDDATFEFNAAESVYLVAKGEWIKTGKGKDDPDGLFYLTDQRLIFERKEKEGGFLGFGGKKVQGIEWEIPLNTISSVESEKKGFLGGKDIVHIQLSSGGPANPTSIEVKGGLNANWYAQQLERAKAGDIEQERATTVDPEVVERVRNAPTQCANCGAPFTTPITRNMTEMACEYCGTIVRI